MPHSVDQLPGYRRRIRVAPREGVVTARLEDDIHCMAVTLRHAGGVVSAVEPDMVRWPWTTCPGAREQLVRTFAGLRLGEITARRDKRLNCTHLHDLAVIAAAHADDAADTTWDVLVSDPVAGERLLELRRDGKRVLAWREQDGVLAEQGVGLLALRDWIAALPAAEREDAQILQWAAVVAHGRTIPFERQSDASQMPPTCWTFQPERAGAARRVGTLRDFSSGGAEPLDTFSG